mgnify:CR=1 FL=1
MYKRSKIATSGLALAVLAASTGITFAGDHANYCMDVEIEPFHMMPGYMTEEGACAVRDYADGELQEAFYPFTKEDHLFNCDYFAQLPPLMDEAAPGDLVPLPNGAIVPSSVASIDKIEGTIDGHPFEAKLLCASLTNWYQDSCLNPEDPKTCTFQLAQPFLEPTDKGFYPRVTEVSVFDGKITVHKGRQMAVEVPILMATRAAGITHVESMDPPEVGASVTHSLLGLVTYDTDDGYGHHHRKKKVLDGSADLLLQGHIFFPGPVEEDLKPDGSNAAAVIKGSICSKDLYKQLNRKEKGHGHGHGGGHPDDSHYDDD